MYNKCLTLALHMAAGYKTWAERIFDQPFPADRRVHEILGSSAYLDQKHGLPDPYIDRCSVVIYGPLAETYLQCKHLALKAVGVASLESSRQSHQGQPIDASRPQVPRVTVTEASLIFGSLIARSLLNAFLVKWITSKGDPPTPGNWDESLASELAQTTWQEKSEMGQRPSMGYSARALPTTKGGGERYSVVPAMLSEAATKLTALVDQCDPDNIFPVSLPRSNAKTFAFVTFLTGSKTGLYQQVLARDWSRLFPTHDGQTMIDESVCLFVYPGAKPKFEEVWPACPHVAAKSLYQSTRLAKLNDIVLPLAIKLAGTAAHAIPHALSPVTLQHHCCDVRQQEREKPIRARERRDNDTLRLYTLLAWDRLWQPSDARTAEEAARQEALKKRLQTLIPPQLLLQCRSELSLQSAQACSPQPAETTPAILRQRIKKLTADLEEERALRRRLQPPASWQ